MSFPKLVFNDSFDFGGMPLSFIADDGQRLKKSAADIGSSPVVEQWGKVDPIKDHSLVHLVALGEFEKTGKNRNGDAFKRAICESSHPTFITHGAFYSDHVAGPGAPRFGGVTKTARNADMGRVELLVAVSHKHKKSAEFLSDVEKGKQRAVSMGFACDYDVCSICNHRAKNRSEYCEHVKKGALEPYGLGRILPDGRACYVDNPAGHWNDISMVPVGADRIAMSLRKVAGLDGALHDETVGGAELAERYGLIGAVLPDARKLALAAKLSAMEKRVEAAGIRTVNQRRREARPVSKQAQEQIRALPPADMFALLAKHAALLPPADFTALIFGFDTGVAFKTAGLFTRLENEPAKLAAVCATTLYDPTPLHSLVTPGVTKRAALAEYARGFSLHAGLAAERAGQGAMKTAGFDGDDEPVETPGARALAEHYAAYKLAALLAMDVNGDVDDARLLAAVLEG